MNLRIEGADSTIYEKPIVSSPRNITTASGGSHLCNGENDGANPTPGATPTTALDAASKLPETIGGGFGFDGTFDSEFNDFFITTIGDTTQTATEFWGLLVNYQFTPVAGCQFETKAGDKVLWAFNAFNQGERFLELSGPKLAKKGKAFEVSVIDGMTDTPVQGATVGGAITNATGYASIVPTSAGVLSLKAEASNSIRSNRLDVLVA